MTADEYKAKIKSLEESYQELKQVFDTNGKKDIAADTALFVVNVLIRAEKAALKCLES